MLIIVTTERIRSSAKFFFGGQYLHSKEHYCDIYRACGANALVIIIIEGTLVFVVLPITMVWTMNNINGAAT
jgi:hypothetical protein